MIYTTNGLIEAKLLSLKESGMGYQIVEASKRGFYSTSKFVVYNAELVIDLDESFSRNQRELKQLGFENAIARFSSNQWSIDASSIKLSSTNFIDGNIASEPPATYGSNHGATDSQPQPANGYDVFVRISHYRNDKRVDQVHHRLLDGTYTTTEDDYWYCVNSGDDPIERYALPNDETIEWAFYVKPAVGDPFRKGIVQPAFSRRGGGIEALFDHGTSINTLQKTVKYGQ